MKENLPFRNRRTCFVFFILKMYASKTILRTKKHSSRHVSAIFFLQTFGLVFHFLERPIIMAMFCLNRYNFVGYFRSLILNSVEKYCLIVTYLDKPKHIEKK